MKRTENFKVSVIIPTHNRERYIMRAIKSAIYQSIKPHEIIVINDASSDRTEEIIKKFSDKIIYLKCSYKNAAAARDYGIRRSTGNWIAFLDSDDLWYPDHLKQFIKNIGEEDAAYCSDCDLMFENAPGIHKNTCQWSFAEPKTDLTLNDFINLYFSQSYFNFPSIVINKKLYYSVKGFNEKFIRRHDIDLWLRILHKSSWTYNPLSTCLTLADNPESISRSVAKASLYLLKVFITNSYFLKNLDNYPPLMRKLTHSAFISSFMEGDKDDRESFKEYISYLDKNDKVFFHFAYFFPDLFISLNRMRHKFLY